MEKLYQGISKIKQIDPLELDWFTLAETREIVDALGRDNLRFVGGAVRDSLLGLPVTDVDVAVSIAPDEVMERLKKAKIKAIPTGIEHGTITAVVDQKSYEITTLRHDVKSHGRHADVEFTDDWQADAKRRDFTINALYLDEDGNIYDYFDGRNDLESSTVRFIGDATKRIEEDALRVLRYFRFLSRFGLSKVKDGDSSLAAVISKASLLTNLSGERIREELKKLLMGKDCAEVLALMMDKGVWRFILPDFEIEPLKNLLAVERAIGKENVFLRLKMVLPKKMSGVREAVGRIKLSNAESAFLMGLLHPDPRVSPDVDDIVLREASYRYGMEDVMNFAILNSKVEQADELKVFLQRIDGYEPPEFPVMGRHLIDMGLKAGPELGEMLAFLEEQWIESNFLISRDDLLEMASPKIIH